MSEVLHDVLVIGAGPTGLACAIAAQNLGLRVVLVDKGCLTNSLFHYPAHKLDVRQYELVGGVTGADGDFTVHTTDQFGRKIEHRARKLIVSTGYYDLPNTLGIPGEDLPKVRHYYNEPHPYFAQDVVVIGGKNSAAIAALDLWRHGARVTLVHRGVELHRHIKYWIKPDIENRIKNGEIAAHFNTTVSLITEDSVTLETAGGPKVIPNQFVFALTGYQPDFAFIESMGVRLDADNARCPVCNPETLETNVPGLYVAGVVVAGERTNEVFIENGRFHGAVIAADLARKMTGVKVEQPVAPDHTVAAE